MITHPLSGVVPPLVTPLTPEYEVDVPSLVRMIDHMLNAGVHGVFVLGTCGEGTFLSDQQRKAVLETTVGHVAGAVPVLTGVIDTSTWRVRQQIEQALAAGVDGLVASAPFYAATHPAEIERHFRALADFAGDTPLFAYDIPSRVGTKLSSTMLLQLATDGVLAGVKDSSGIDSSIRRLVLDRELILPVPRGLEGATPRPAFAILTGSELHVDTALVQGADGVVPGLSNVDPAGYVRIFEAVAAGDHATARKEQDRLFRLFDIIQAPDKSRMGNSSSALGAFKAGLYLRGVIDCPITMFPSIPLDQTEIDAIAGLLRADGLL